jgi:hypothetical protein
MSPRLPLSAAAARGLPLIALAAACIQQQDPEFGGGGDNNPSGELHGGGSGGDGADGGGGGDGATDGATDSGGDGGDGGEPTFTGTGYQVGDVAYNLVATDHTGQEWSLWSAAGEPVVLVVGSLTPGASLDQMLTWLDDVDREEDVTVAILLGYDETTAVADQADAAAAWGRCPVTSVLIGDTNLTDYTLWSDANPPKLYLIDRDMVIRVTSYGAASEDSVRAAISAL